MKASALAFALVLACGWSAAACGDSAAPDAAPSSAAAAPPPAPIAAPQSSNQRADGPCGLVTQAEAEALLKGAVDRPRPEGRLGTGRSACFYENRNGSVQVTVTRFANDGEALERYAALRKLYRGSDTRDVPGIGMEAFWSRGQLVVRQAAAHLTVTLKFEDDRKLTSFNDAVAVDGLIAAERQLAGVALSRLPPMP